mmetsp:Transcript_70737/g.218472  ORF Transcript_70737/g.218472 Transcript_70737/m.218472 type:complete len:291 (-) Transcript_70737:1016-1888(-)
MGGSASEWGHAPAPCRRGRARRPTRRTATTNRLGRSAGRRVRGPPPPRRPPTLPGSLLASEEVHPQLPRLAGEHVELSPEARLAAAHGGGEVQAFWSSVGTWHCTGTSAEAMSFRPCQCARSASAPGRGVRQPVWSSAGNWYCTGSPCSKSISASASGRGVGQPVWASVVNRQCTGSPCSTSTSAEAVPLRLCERANCASLRTLRAAPAVGRSLGALARSTRRKSLTAWPISRRAGHTMRHSTVALSTSFSDLPSKRGVGAKSAKKRREPAPKMSTFSSQRPGRKTSGAV